MLLPLPSLTRFWCAGRVWRVVVLSSSGSTSTCSPCSSLASLGLEKEKEETMEDRRHVGWLYIQYPAQLPKAQVVLTLHVATGDVELIGQMHHCPIPHRMRPVTVRCVNCTYTHCTYRFQLEWLTEVRCYHIFKELFAGLVSCAVWGRHWRGSWVRWLCDNQVVVHAVNKRSCCNQAMMHLIRCLFFLEAWFCFKLIAAHLPRDLEGENLFWSRLPIVSSMTTPLLCRISPTA